MIDDSADSPPESPGDQSGRSGRWRVAEALLLVQLLCSCAQPPSIPESQLEADRKRLHLLEQRVEILERYIYNLPSPPQRSRDEIEDNIRSLEAKRSALLVRYTDLHPAVREVDLTLRLLKLQLEMMEQAGKPAK